MLETGRKPFPGAITLETTQLCGKQTKTCFLCDIRLKGTQCSAQRSNLSKTCFGVFAVWAGLSFLSHKKSVFLRVCLNNLLSALLQEKHVLVCFGAKLCCF